MVTQDIDPDEGPRRPSFGTVPPFHSMMFNLVCAMICALALIVGAIVFGIKLGEGVQTPFGNETSNHIYMVVLWLAYVVFAWGTLKAAIQWDEGY